MTEQLRTLLHDKADGVDFAVPDPEVLTAAGDHRVRRRRSMAAGGLLTVALVVGAVSALGGGDHGQDGAPVVARPAPESRAVTWAKGSVIHAGDRTVDVGHEVRAYVETSVGYVVADADGNVWSVVDGNLTQVGTIDARHPRLVADPAGPLAAWVGTASHSGGPDAISWVDQSRMSGGSARIAPQHGPAEADALSGTTLYLHDDRGAVTHDLLTTQERIVDPAGKGESFEGLGVLAAHDGTLAMQADAGTLVGTSRDHAVLLDQAYGSIGTFSPDGAYYSNDADSPSLWDVRTGRQVPVPGMDDYAFSTGFEWLDDRTLVLIAQQRKGDPMVLVTCEVPDGSSCHRVATLGGLDHPDYQLPVGQPIDDD